MSDYSAVQKALEGGAQPAMLCGTCPWDRHCVSPPTMTKGEIDAKMAEAATQDEQKHAQAQAAGRNPEMPVGTLLTAVMYAGRDTSAQVCPVFALRLRSSGGRDLSDTVKSAMQGWDDDQ